MLEPSFNRLVDRIVEVDNDLYNGENSYMRNDSQKKPHQ